MLEATLRLEVPGCWTARFGENGTRVRIVDRKVVSGRIKNLFEVERGGRKEDWPAVIADLSSMDGVAHVEAVSNDPERLLGIVECRGCTSCRAFLSSECFVTGVLSREGGMDWTLRFEDRAKLAALVEDLKRRRVPASVMRVVTLRGASTLTARQGEVLRVAMDMGYFEFPKRVGIEDVANRLGVSKSTASETLHRAEEKVLQSFLERPA